MNKIKFTKDGFLALQREYEELTRGKRPAAIERLQKARSMGDLSENSEYNAAKEDLAFIEGRIRELEALIKNSVVVENQSANGQIEIGSSVLLEQDGQKEKFMIVGEFEADPVAKKLSSNSPIGQALIGKKKGDMVIIQVPAGKLVYKIIEVFND